MSEEKIRNYKSGLGESAATDNIPSFLLKTYEILENHKYSDVICWTKNGEGFVVKRVKDFAENILPTHFRHSNYTSFVRQLNMYDFHKTRQENQQNAFKNAMFKRGHKHLLKEIQRKDYKKKKEKPESALEKSGAIHAETQPKADKKVEIQKEFYSKSLMAFQKMMTEMEKKQAQLAEITEIPQNDAGISYFLENLISAKNLNHSFMFKISQISRDWDSLILKKRKVSKISMNDEKLKDSLDPTYHTFNLLAREQKL